MAAAMAKKKGRSTNLYWILYSFIHMINTRKVLIVLFAKASSNFTLVSSKMSRSHFHRQQSPTTPSLGVQDHSKLLEVESFPIDTIHTFILTTTKRSHNSFSQSAIKCYTQESDTKVNLIIEWILGFTSSKSKECFFLRMLDVILKSCQTVYIIT